MLLPAQGKIFIQSSPFECILPQMRELRMKKRSFLYKQQSLYYDIR